MITDHQSEALFYARSCTDMPQSDYNMRAIYIIYKTDNR